MLFAIFTLLMVQAYGSATTLQCGQLKTLYTSSNCCSPTTEGCNDIGLGFVPCATDTSAGTLCQDANGNLKIKDVNQISCMPSPGTCNSHCPNGFGINTHTPDPSAAIDITSTTRGFLMPRMSKDERDYIATPANGLMVYQINETPGFYFYNGTAWLRLN